MKNILILVIIAFTIKSQAQEKTNPSLQQYGNILGIQRVYNEITNSDYTQLFYRYFDDMKINSFDSVAIISHYFINKKGKTVSVIIGKKGTITKIYENAKLIITDTVPNRFSQLYSAIIANEKDVNADSLFWMMYLRMDKEISKREKIPYYEDWKEAMRRLDLTNQFEIGLKETNEIASHILSLLKIENQSAKASTSIQEIFKTNNIENQLYFYPRSPAGNYVAKYENFYPEKPSKSKAVLDKEGEDIIPDFLKTSYAYINSNTILPVRDLLYNFYFHRLFPEYKTAADSFTSVNKVTYLSGSLMPEYVKYTGNSEENYTNGKIYQTIPSPYPKYALENFLYYTKFNDKGLADVKQWGYFKKRNFEPSSKAAFQLQEDEKLIHDSEISNKILELQKVHNDVISYIRKDDKTNNTQLWLGMNPSVISRKPGDVALLNIHWYSRRIVPIKTKIDFSLSAFEYAFGYSNIKLPKINNNDFPQNFREYLLYNVSSPPFQREGTIFNYMIGAQEYSNFANVEAAIQQYMAAYMKVKYSIASPLHKAIIKNKITEELIKLYRTKGEIKYADLLKLNSDLLIIQALHTHNVIHAYDDVRYEEKIDLEQDEISWNIWSNNTDKTFSILGAIGSVGTATLTAVSANPSNMEQYYANKATTDAYMNRASSFITEASNYSSAFKAGMAKFSTIDFENNIEINDFDIVWRNLSQMTTESLIETTFLFQATLPDSIQNKKLEQKYHEIVKEYVDGQLPSLKDKLQFSDPNIFEAFEKEFAANEILQFNLALRGKTEKKN